MPIRFIIGPNEIEDLVVEVEGDVIEFSLFLYQAITTGTPVDTGHARVNWLIDFANFVARVEGTRPEIPGREPRSGALIGPPSDAKLETWTADRGNIFIHNSVEYVQFLEDNSSDQTDGQGIIMPALAAAQARFA